MIEPAPASSLSRTRLRMARAVLPAALVLPDYLPARMLNEFVYCRRLFFYEWVDGLFAHSADTLDGAHRHEQHDRKEHELLPPEDAERIHARSVTLSSDTHGLIAKLDLIEGEGSGVTPVDYKRGAPKDTGEGPEAWPADRVQLCAQALVLREHGYDVTDAVAYYYETKQRVRLAVDEELVAETVEALRAARAIAASGRIPPPLVDSPKCPRCSLVGICLPDETRRAMGLEPEAPESQPSLFGSETESAHDRPLDTSPEEAEIRRLVPARDDLRPLYVTGFALTVGKSDDVLQVRDKKQLIQEVRVHDISQVNVFGAVTVTGPALQALCWAEKPVSHFTHGGWFAGMTSGMGLKNVFLRIAQV
ncbi:MAG: CRISPR-associated protein Cas4, partial [Vicinamibacterales bacterium]